MSKENGNAGNHQRNLQWQNRKPVPDWLRDSLQGIHVQAFIEIRRVTQDGGKNSFEDQTKVQHVVARWTVIRNGSVNNTHSRHALMVQRISSSFTNDQIGPLYDDNGDEESSVAGVFQSFALLIGLEQDCHLQPQAKEMVLPILVRRNPPDRWAISIPTICASQEDGWARSHSQPWSLGKWRIPPRLESYRFDHRPWRSTWKEMLIFGQRHWSILPFIDQSIVLRVTGSSLHDVCFRFLIGQGNGRNHVSAQIDAQNGDGAQR